jgi:hypothetical protein
MDAVASGGFSCRTKTRQRTVKSCGPGAATLALRRSELQRGHGGKKGRSPGRARISRKTIARGKPGCLGCTCLTRVHSFATSRTRGCGCRRRPAFPAPSVRRRDNEFAKLGRKRAAGTRTYVTVRRCEERSDDPSPLAPQASQGWESAEARRAKAEAMTVLPAVRVGGRPDPDLLSIAAFPGTAKPIMVAASLPQDEAG